MLRLVFAGCLAFAPFAAADDKKDADPSPAEKIHLALQIRKNLDIDSQSLHKVAEAMASIADIRVEIDSALLIPGNPGVTAYEGISLRGKNLPLGAALQTALAPHGLTWIVLADRVLLTTHERAPGLQLQQRLLMPLSGKLAKVLDGISRSHGVILQLDPGSEKQGETEVKFNPRGATLEAAVHILSAQAGLQAVRLDNALFVTTAEKAKLLPGQLAPIPALQPQFPGLLGQIGQIGAFGNQIGFVGVMGAAIGVAGNGGAAPAPAPMKEPKKEKNSTQSFRSRHALLSLAMAAPVPAADKTKKADEEPSPQSIRKALNTAITLEATALPLPQLIVALKEKTGVDFVLDRAVLDPYFMERSENGTGVDGATVTGRLSKTPVRRGLKSLLSEHNLGYAIVGDQVLITTQAMATTRQLRQIVTVDVDKVAVADALKKLARETGINLVLDSRAAKEGQEKVTLQLEDVPLETAVKLLTEQAGMKVVIVDNVLFATTKAKAVEMRDDPDFKPRIDDPNDPRFVPPGMGGGGAGGKGMPLPAKEAPIDENAPNDKR